MPRKSNGSSMRPMPTSALLMRPLVDRRRRNAKARRISFTQNGTISMSMIKRSFFCVADLRHVVGERIAEDEVGDRHAEADENCEDEGADMRDVSRAVASVDEELVVLEREKILGSAAILGHSVGWNDSWTM